MKKILLIVALLLAITNICYGRPIYRPYNNEPYMRRTLPRYHRHPYRMYANAIVYFYRLSLRNR